jgi:hypothetical protein
MVEPRRGATIGCRRRSATPTRGARGVGGEDGDHLLLGQSLDGEVLGDLAGEQAEGGVELVGDKEAQHVGGDALAHADLDAGVRLGEAGQQLGDVDVSGRPERSDPDAPAQDPAKLVDFLACTVDFGQDAASTSGDRLPRLGRADATARALDARRVALRRETQRAQRAQLRADLVKVLLGTLNRRATLSHDAAPGT